MKMKCPLCDYEMTGASCDRCEAILFTNYDTDYERIDRDNERLQNIGLRIRETSSTTGRLEYWDAVLEMWLDIPRVKDWT